jgi:hypothetical protein
VPEPSPISSDCHHARSVGQRNGDVAPHRAAGANRG